MRTHLTKLADVAMHSMYSGHVGLEVALLGCFIITQVAGVFLTLQVKNMII
jgi:hypothetical protein